MTPAPVEARLRGVIARVAKVQPNFFGPDDNLAATLGLDSLSTLRVVAGIEREFGITIPDDRFHELPTLRSILSLLEEEGAKGSAKP